MSNTLLNKHQKTEFNKTRCRPSQESRDFPACQADCKCDVEIYILNERRLKSTLKLIFMKNEETKEN